MKLFTAAASLLIFSSSLLTAQRHTEFSQQNAADILHTLCVTIGPRPMGSPADQSALRFALGKFKEYGCDTAYIMPMTYTSRDNTSSGIAVGIKRGAAGRIIIIGGHIDSAGPEIPGADDDGSGAATVMELCRVLARRSNQSTLVFCCYSGEEQGLEGSKYFVDHFDDIDSVAMAIQIDMANGLGIIDLDPDSYNINAPKWLVKAVVEEFHNLGYEHLRYPTHFFAFNYSTPHGSGSDHESFLQRGIPAFDLSTDVSKPIHTPRDNWENYDPRGLQRSGDVALKLVERFDNGVPSGKPERYWLYLLGSTPIFLPMWGLWIIYSVAFMVMIAAFVALMMRRPAPVETRIRWSWPKTLLLSFILVCCAWFSSDLAGLLKGIRHPWFIDIPSYYVQAALGFLIGIGFIAHLTARLRITRDPLPLFRHAAILLSLMFGLFCLMNIKLGLYPAAGILLLSIAVLNRIPGIHYALIIAAPMMMLRLIFSEWGEMLLRSFAVAMPADSVVQSIMINGTFAGLLTLVVLPYILGAAAVMRDSPGSNALMKVFRSRSWLLSTVIAFAAYTGFLLARPSYDQYWYRDLHVRQSYDLKTNKFVNPIRSGEYLSGLRIQAENLDTTISGHTCFVSIPPRGKYDTTWLHVDREEHRTTIGDSTRIFIRLTLTAPFRPYTVNLSYNGGQHDPLFFTSGDWIFRSATHERKELSWYSFPEMPLVVPISFMVVGNDSVKETISVVYDSLAYPMAFQREQTYIIPRTEFFTDYVYRR